MKSKSGWYCKRKLVKSQLTSSTPPEKSVKKTSEIGDFFNKRAENVTVEQSAGRSNELGPATDVTIIVDDNMQADVESEPDVESEHESSDGSPILSSP